jgi:tetratricopeptide (TPR) repeat protein
MATPIWMLVAVAFGAVAVTLAIVYVGFRVFVAAPTSPTVAEVPLPATQVPTTVSAGLRSTPAGPESTSAAVAGQSTPAAQPLTASGTSAGCTTSQSDAQSLAQARRWSDAAAKLEAVRNQCDVVGPLYDAYVNQARTLADDERPAEAISVFDKALQVKNGSEATNERALAVAYQDGRTALDGGDFDAAIDKLSRVQAAKPDYARGNNVLNLVNAYLSKGDALVSQAQCPDALAYFQRAQALKPGESAIVQRISSAQQCNRPTLLPAPAAPPPVAAPVVAPASASVQALELTVRAYYEAINSRQFAGAYSILSSSAQASQSLANFAGRFSATRSIATRYIDGVSIQGSSAQLNAHTQTVTAGSAGLSTSCSRVVWVLLVEDGQWRRDIRSESANEFAERC